MVWFCLKYESVSCSIYADIQFENSVSYIQNWRDVIKEQPNAFIVAAQRAQKAVDYIRAKE